MKALKIGLASALALATAAPVMAQSAYQPTEQYRRDMDRYQAERARYADSQADYRAARAAYERRRADWIVAQSRYDARYGSGAYIRVYGPMPVWDETNWRSAGYYAVDTAYVEPCRRTNGNAVAGGVVGALIGAALGSNVAASGRATEGAVLGGVVGAGLGAAVGNSSDRVRCDRTGVYYSYADTLPYREASYDRMRNSGRYNYSYYSRQRCRLAAAPYTDAYRYVRVCPDRYGRYRITG